MGTLDVGAGEEFVPFAPLTAALGIGRDRAAAESIPVATGARSRVARNIGTTCLRRPNALCARTFSHDGVVRADGLKSIAASARGFEAFNV